MNWSLEIDANVFGPALSFREDTNNFDEVLSVVADTPKYREAEYGLSPGTESLVMRDP
jgi:hypothetical protein